MYTKEQEYTSDGKVYVGIFSSKEPETFPQDSGDVTDVKDGYEFAAGSYIYVVDTAKIYLWDSVSKVWTEQ